MAARGVGQETGGWGTRKSEGRDGQGWGDAHGTGRDRTDTSQEPQLDFISSPALSAHEWSDF